MHALENGDYIHTCYLVTPTEQVHLCVVILRNLTNVRMLFRSLTPKQGRQSPHVHLCWAIDMLWVPHLACIALGPPLLKHFVPHFLSFRLKVCSQFREIFFLSQYVSPLILKTTSKRIMDNVSSVIHLKYYDTMEGFDITMRTDGCMYLTVVMSL